MKRLPGLLIGMCIVTLFSYAQNEEEIKIRTFLPEKEQDLKGASKYSLKVAKSWPEDADLPLDSILFSSTIKWNHENAFQLYLFSKLSNDSLHIGLLKRDNSLLYKDYMFAYHQDSVKKWKSLSLYSYVSPRIDIPLTEKAIIDTLELYLSPVTMFSFTDQRINNFPVSVCGTDVKFRLADFNDNNLSFSIPNGTLNSTEITLHVVDKEGRLHRKSIVNNFQYKDSYIVGDTVCLSDDFYLFREFDVAKKEAYFQKLLIHGMEPKYIPANALKKVEPYFTEGKKFLLLDFWGTWCGPCVASLPDMVNLYKDIQKDFAFLGVCFDEKENEEKAKKIYEEHRIEWPDLFEDMSGPDRRQALPFMLSVSSFPSCIVIDREGRIYLRVTGFDNLQKNIHRIY